MFGFGSKKEKGATPGEQYNRNNQEVIARPADAPQPEAQKAPAPAKEQQPAQTPEKDFYQMLLERGLSQVSLKYKDMSILILHEIDPGKAPQRIEKVIDRWHNLPGANPFDVLSFKRHFYCLSNETGKVDLSVEVPEKHAQLAQEEQDEKVRELMVELTGEQPATAAGVLTVELLNATSMDDLVDIFYDMKWEDRQRVMDAAHKAMKKRKQEAEGRRQKSGGGDSGDGGDSHKPAPRPQPVRQTTPQATGLGATRRRRGG